MLGRRRQTKRKAHRGGPGRARKPRCAGGSAWTPGGGKGTFAARGEIKLRWLKAAVELAAAIARSHFPQARNAAPAETETSDPPPTKPGGTPTHTLVARCS
jgi:hypothetical protein